MEIPSVPDPDYFYEQRSNRHILSIMASHSRPRKITLSESHSAYDSWPMGCKGGLVLCNVR